MKILIVVPSLSVGIDEQGCPRVTMNFSKLFAEAITRRLLAPYARPDNFMVSVELLADSDNLEISAYGIITAPRLLDLPGRALMVLPVNISEGFEYVVGNEADLGQNVVTNFLAGISQKGYFLLSCGVRTEQPDKTAVLPGWNLRLEKLSEKTTITERICKAFDD